MERVDPNPAWDGVPGSSGWHPAQKQVKAIGHTQPRDLLKHIRALDGVRAVAILLVFCNHALHLHLLWMGVDLFFILSGFLITRILLSRKEQKFSSYIGQFYARRAYRILPAYLVFLLVISLVYGLWWARHWYLYLGLMNFITWKDIPQPAAMGVLWSLAVEEQFYLVWPLAVFFLSRRHLKWLALAMMVLAPVLRAGSAGWFNSHWATYELLPFRMDTLALGGLLGICWPEVSRLLATRKQFVGASILLVWAASATCLWWLGHIGIRAYDVSPLGDVLVFLATLLLMGGLFLFAAAGYLRPFFESSVLRWLAQISYSFYLFHYLILEKVGDRPLLAFTLTVLVASALWLCLEKPIMEHGKRREATKKVGAAQPPMLTGA